MPGATADPTAAQSPSSPSRKGVGDSARMETARTDAKRDVSRLGSRIRVLTS